MSRSFATLSHGIMPNFPQRVLNQMTVEHRADVSRADSKAVGRQLRQRFQMRIDVTVDFEVRGPGGIQGSLGKRLRIVAERPKR